ncbi:uncharacterized protein LOC122211941 isoform X2 [Panthera leo]|uniref:uncharacterized protein LOC122211941 isoform X2 n=1 Tax=Panthera leo TaxID=9689 RepID=UPI001C69F61F|nr:uncharacterized protein LOC122211941 isoform X2 [Panthera leo]
MRKQFLGPAPNLGGLTVLKKPSLSLPSSLLLEFSACIAGGSTHSLGGQSQQAPRGSPCQTPPATDEETLRGLLRASSRSTGPRRGTRCLVLCVSGRSLGTGAWFWRRCCPHPHPGTGSPGEGELPGPPCPCPAMAAPRELRQEVGGGRREGGTRAGGLRGSHEDLAPRPLLVASRVRTWRTWTCDLRRKAWREVGASVTSVPRQARSPCAGDAPAEVSEAPGLSSLAGSPFPLGAVVQLSPGNVRRCRRDGNPPRCLTAALPPSSCLSSLLTSEVTGRGLGKGRRHIWGASRPAPDGGGTGERCARIWPSVSWLCGLRSSGA